MLFLEKLVADQRQTRTLVDQIVLWMPQLIETKVLAAKKEIKDEASGSEDTEEFKAQLAEMRTQIAKPVHVPTPFMPESLMQMLTQEPSTKSLDEFWGEHPKAKSGKRQHRAGESVEERPTDPTREERRREKRSRKASRKEAQEKEVREQQQRETTLS
uniref:Integrase core domain containing protein n=1 Tax=Solanum tuberosum TaxID=4113 RepID=M1DNU9_SOLTU